MNKLKNSIFLIILGNISYILFLYLTNKVPSINNFISGILLGISITINLLGVVLIANYIKQEKKEKK